MRLNEQVDYNAARERARTRGELVWHYTTLDTLALILQGNFLLATEVSFQNDIRETSTADSAFAAALDSLVGDDKYVRFARAAQLFLDEQDTRSPALGSVWHDLTRNARFILCGSDDTDSLYAWRTYANGGIGCAIGLDPKAPLGMIDPDSDTNLSAHRVRHWRQVVYQPGRVRQAAERELVSLGDRWLKARARDRAEESADEAVRLLIMHLGDARSNIRALAKDPSFSDEHEQRVTVETMSHKAITTTPSSMGPRPHVRLVAGEHGWGEVYAKADLAPKLPIRAIRLGPNAPDSALASTQWLLLAHGYPLDPSYVSDDPGPQTPRTWEETVIIDQSVHPYRAR